MTAEEFQDTVDRVAKELGGRITAKKAGLPESVATTPVPKLPFRPKNQVKEEVIETLPSSPSPPSQMGRLYKIKRELPQGVRLVPPSWASSPHGGAQSPPTCSASSQSKAPTTHPQLEAAPKASLLGQGQLSEDGPTWSELRAWARVQHMLAAPAPWTPQA